MVSCQLGTNESMKHGHHLALCLLQLEQEMQCHSGGQTAQPQGGQWDSPPIQARGTRNQGLQQASQDWSSAADQLKKYSALHTDGLTHRLPGVEECDDVNKQGVQQVGALRQQC